MTAAQWWMAAVAVVLVMSSVVMSRVDSAMRAKAKADFERHADDAIDLTGGAR